MKKIFAFVGYITVTSTMLGIADYVLGVHYLGSWWMGLLARLGHLAVGGMTIFFAIWLLEMEVKHDQRDKN